MTAPNPTTITLLALTPLFAWRIYRRFRRLIGRQRFSPVRLCTTLVVYTVVVIVFGVAGWNDPAQLCWLIGSVVIGVLLGCFGLKKTRFEPTPEGLFYTPHAHLGIALSSLFVARIIYRFAEISASNPMEQPQMVNFTASPLTLVVFGLLAGYYVTYAIGLIRWRFRVARANPQSEAVKLEQDPT